MRKWLRNIRDRLKGWTRAGRPAGPAEEPHLAPELSTATAATRHTAEREASAEAAAPGEEKKRRRSRRRGPRKDEAAPAAALVWDSSEFAVTPMEGKTRFHDFVLAPTIMHGIADAGFQYCTPIQTETLRDSLAGKDIVGRAQTGTGKTAAFLITLFQRLLDAKPHGGEGPSPPRALVLAPTRELVMQIAKDAEALGRYLPLKVLAVFGGMDFQSQQRQLEEGGVDVVVATPGRLIDFSRRRMVRLDQVEMLVIDEADRMLDMGFIPDVRRIVAHLPKEGKRQTMFYSATITDDVKRLAFQWTKDPVHVDIEPEQVAVDTVDQVVYLATSEEKYAILFNLIQREHLERVMVFTNRRDETRRLTERLTACHISCAMLSGDVAQEKRVRTLEQFRSGKIRVLVATDVAGRGVHIEGVSHVVNFHLPHNPEDFVHRIGRTGRAGASGIAVSFADEEDAFYLPDIEKFIGRPLTCIHPDDELLVAPPEKPRSGPPSGGERRDRRPQNRSSRSRGPGGPGGRSRQQGGRRS